MNYLFDNYSLLLRFYLLVINTTIKWIKSKNCFLFIIFNILECFESSNRQNNQTTKRENDQRIINEEGILKVFNGYLHKNQNNH